MNNKKIDLLKKTNHMISNKINDLVSKVSEYENVSFFNSKILYDNIYENSNKETSYLICNIKKGQKTNNLIENDFKKIICLEGKIVISIPSFNEKTTLNSLNSIFIPPDTEYSINIIEDSQIIGILKSKKEKELYNSIYSKKENE